MLNRSASLVGLSLLGTLLSSCSMMPVQSVAAGEMSVDPAARCAALGSAMAGNWPDPTTRIISARFQPAGTQAASAPAGTFGPPPPPLPGHCEVIGMLQERTGVDSQKYAIRFHLRLPQAWNHRFFMQGGGGTNGELGDAIGMLGEAARPALLQGYAVLSQDSGHDNATNSDTMKGGAAAFGLDPQARANYGGASLPPTVAAAKALVAAFYGAGPQHSYFVGCSKGGQEGMAAAQRYPDLFDGIVAAAPGFSLPRAAVSQAWDTQSFANVVRANGQPVTSANLAASFSDADLSLVGKAVIEACDADDGIVDGIVGDHPRCTSAKILPRLKNATCKGAKDAGCLSVAQIDALVRTHEGVKNSHGKSLYAPFPWDAGWADMGWRIWKIGSPDGRIPPINIAMGAPALGLIFTTPPTVPKPGLDGAIAYALAFDFNTDSQRIDETGGNFVRSGWQDVSARSPDISAFARRGGKIIVPHGVSDPVFSITDTINWWNEVDRLQHGRAAQTVRVYPIPGMAHCSGGPATDSYDALSAIVAWVEKGEAPASLAAKAGPRSPWPGRKRPLCAYPAIARYDGKGDVNEASSFICS